MQRSVTECGVPEYNREPPLTKNPWPIRVCGAIEVLYGSCEDPVCVCALFLPACIDLLAL